MNTPRANHTTVLLSNGKVLVAGGRNNGVSLASAELYDPVTNTWSNTGSLANARHSHTATLLPNGKVLVVGGIANTSLLASAELYDPATGTWSAGANLSAVRSDHTATLLNNGKVLVAGGFDAITITESATLYDPATNIWANAGSLAVARAFHTATLLQNGMVLVAGGFPNSAGNTVRTELYNPSTNSWSNAGDLITPRGFHTATLLPNGKVLVAGGRPAGFEDLSSTELYDPAMNTWSAAGSLGALRSEHTATLLQNGKVLVAGDRFEASATSEIFDPATNSWTDSGGLTADRGIHTATLLQSGKVLLTGGFANNRTSNSAELYDAAPVNSAGPQIVFGSSRNNGNHDIYVMALDGSNQIRLTTNPGYDDQPKWSPDGSRIAFMSNRDGNFEIYKMNSDGSGQIKLTNDPAGDGFPAWSPDGARIAFVSGDLRNPSTFEIYVMNSDGTNRTRLTNDSLIDGVPSWSPDGTKIIFMSGASSVFDPNSFEIYAINADGSNRTRLTNNAVVDGQPSYSPDGTKILFASGDAMNPNGIEIYLMNPDGSNRTRLTNNSVTDGFPTWSRDGQKIFFATGSISDESTVELYVMNSDGSSPVRLTNNSFLDWFADLPPLSTNQIQFETATTVVGEGNGFATINVTRTGDTSAPATVKYATSDATDVNFVCNPNTAGQITGAASRKCDYHITAGRLRFAAGEASKQIVLSIVNDVYVEPTESLTITLSSPIGAALGSPGAATINIIDNDTPGQANPIDNTAFFVRMLYVDLLSREPEPSGLAGWVHRIDFCGQPGEPPPPCDRVTVGGDGFLRSTEFFDREFFVIRLYRTALGRILRYDDVGDLAFVSGFLTDADLELNKQEVISDIMSRPEFAGIYNSLSNGQYVDTMIQTAAVSLPAGVRDGWVSALNGTTKTRAQVFRELSERSEVSAKYLHEAQVVSCYYGFFTRNPDGAYFTFLQRYDNGEINLGDLANAFINAAEYRQRFGP